MRRILDNRKNKKGQAVGLSILIGIIFLIISFTTLNLLRPIVEDTRTNLSCASPTTISDGTKLLCLVTTATFPYVIMSILSVAGGFLISRFFK